MKPLQIAATIHTPAVHFDPDTGILEMKGFAIPEDSSYFFKPILDWLETFLDSTDKDIEMVLCLRSVNNSSTDYLTEIFDLLSEAYEDGTEVFIVWDCDPEDEALFELFEELKEDYSLPIETTDGE